MGRKLLYGMFGVVLVVTGTAVFLYPNAAATGVSRGLSVCGSVLIPSLLPFLAVTGTFMRSSLCDTVGRWLTRPTAFLFRLPGVCAAPILLSMIGGYPTGAAATERLLESRKITVKQAERMLHFCVNAGPAFVVGAVGTVLLRDRRVGWMLFGAHLAASLLIGLTEALFAPHSGERTVVKSDALPPMAAFAAAVRSATETLLYMCGFVIVFSVLLSLSDAGGLAALLGQVFDEPAILSGLLEVSGGCVVLAGERSPSMFLFGFFLGFGGLSVHCQVRAILQKHPKALRRFFAFRVLHGLLGGWLSAVLYRVVPLPVQTLATGSTQMQAFAVSPAVSVVLLCMCICFLWSSEKKIAKCR